MKTRTRKMKEKFAVKQDPKWDRCKPVKIEPKTGWRRTVRTVADQRYSEAKQEFFNGQN